MEFVYGKKSMGSIKLSSLIPKRHKGKKKRKISATQKRVITAQRRARAQKDRERVEKAVQLGKGAIHKVSSTAKRVHREVKKEWKLTVAEGKARAKAKRSIKNDSW